MASTLVSFCVRNLEVFQPFRCKYESFIVSQFSREALKRIIYNTNWISFWVQTGLPGVFIQCRTHAKKSGGHGKNQGKPRKGKRLGMKRYEGGRLYRSVIRLSIKFSLFFNIIRIRDAILCRSEIWRYLLHYPRLSRWSTHSTQINRPSPQLEFVLVVINTQKYCQKP